METNVVSESAGSMEDLLASMESHLSKWSTAELVTFLHTVSDIKRKKTSDHANASFDEYFQQIADQIKSYSVDYFMQRELKELDDLLNSSTYFVEPTKHNDFESLQAAELQNLEQRYRSDFAAVAEDDDDKTPSESNPMLDNILARIDNMLVLRMNPGLGLEHAASDDEAPSQSSSKKPRKRQVKKSTATSPSPVPAGIAATPSPSLAKQTASTRPVSRSAKWMNRDAKAARSHVPPSEMLRCVLHELETTGVHVYTVEESMQQHIENGDCKITSEEYSAGLGHIRKIDYAALVDEAREEAEKPYGRTATAAATECCELYRGHVDGIHSLWEAQLTLLRETSSYHWTSLTQLQGQLHQIMFNLSDMPPAAELVVNPFAWNASHCRDMSWIVQLSDISNISVFVSDAKENTAKWRDSKTHPFVHAASLYFGSVTAEECLTAKQLHDIDSMIHGCYDTECREGEAENKRKRHAKSFYDPTLAPPAKFPRMHVEINNDEKFELARGKASLVDTGACFDFCVDRVCALLSLGHAAIVIDKSKAFESNLQASAHRAMLLHTIVSRIPAVDANKLPNPTLFVVKLKDLYAFRDALREKSSNTLLYFGGDDDREILRSYMTGCFLYSQANPAIILTHYEAFCADLVHLKEVVWGVTMFDSPWSLFTNQGYQRVYDEIASLPSKYRLYSGAELAHTEYGYMPSLVNLISVVFPSIWSILDDTTDVMSDTRAIHYVVQLLASLTAVCNETISFLAGPMASAEDVSQYYEVVKLLPYFEWNGVTVSVNSDQKLQYRAPDKIIYANEYADAAMDEELRHISLNLVGESGARKKVKKQHAKVHGKRHAKTKKHPVIDVTEDVGKKEEDIVKEEPFDTFDSSVSIKEEDEHACGHTGGCEVAAVVATPEVSEEATPDSPALKIETSSFDALDAEATPGTTPTHPPRKPPLDSKALQEIIGKSASKGRSRSTTPKTAKVPMSKKFDPEEEKNRSIFRRGDLWQVIVHFPGRHRYLGSFRSMEEAAIAYEVALQQRPEAEAGNSCLPRVNPADASRKKRKSVDSSDELAKLSDDQLYAGIRGMSAPSQAAGVMPHEWTGPEMRPPAYACLQGTEGFTAYVQHKKCILGKLGFQVRDIATKIGCEDLPGMSGVLEDVDVHLGFDASIARQHAEISFVDDMDCFCITCLHPTGMFVDGELKYPHHGRIFLHTKTIIQIGCRIFYFILPRPADASSLFLLSPLQYRRQLIIAMISSMKLRVIREPLSEAQQEESQEFKTFSDITNKLIENVIGSSKYGKSSSGTSSTASKRKQRESSGTTAPKSKNVKLKTLSPSDAGKARSGIPMSLPADQNQMQYYRPQLSLQQSYTTHVPQHLYHNSSAHVQASSQSHTAFTPLTSPYLASDNKSSAMPYTPSGPSLLSQTPARDSTSMHNQSQGYLSSNMPEMMSSQNSSLLSGLGGAMSSFDVIHNRLPSTDSSSIPTSNLPSLVNNATPLTAFTQSNSVMTAVNRLAQLPPSLPKPPANSDQSTSTQR